MRQYPKSLYFSASWHKADRKISLLVAKTFASKGFLLVGDHPIYRDQDHERGLGYPERVADILDDCSGIVVFWPKRESPQTTSPYMFTEPLYASRSGLPIFILYANGVSIDVYQSGANKILTFGGNNQNTDVLDVDRLDKNGFSDQLVESIFQIDLKNPRAFVGPIKVPTTQEEYCSEEEDIAEAIERFAYSLPSPTNLKFVFNIIPFAMQREHLEIAREVLEQTGMPCFTAEDHRDSQEDVTDRWRSYIDNSTFAIAELSKSRETCSLEVGLAIGKEKPVFIVSKRAVEELPYGTHTRPVVTYNSLSNLRKAIRKYCQPYRRRIINIELKEEGIASQKETGLPKWYFRKIWFDLGRKLLAFTILLSIGISALLATIVRFFEPEQLLAPFIAGTLLTVFGIAVSIFSPLQQLLEKWIANKIKLSLRVALLFAIIASAIFWHVF